MLANKRGNIGFGNLTGLRPINTIITNTNTTTIAAAAAAAATKKQEDNITTTNQYTDTNTKLMKITLDAFERLKNHSRRYYNIES